MLETQKGLKFNVWPDYKLLVVESAKLKEAVSFINSDEFSLCEGIMLGKGLGFHENDLSFLEQIRTLKRIDIADNYGDLSWLYKFEGLTSLNLAENKANLDLLKFPSLISLSLDWNNKVVNLEKCSTLENLTISKLKTPNNNITSFEELTALKSITLIQSTIKSLKGIEVMSFLRMVNLSRCSKLCDIAPLASNLEVEIIDIENCKNLSFEGLTRLKELPKLRKLLLSNCGKIETISFIYDFPSLRFFSFVDTNVIDGDMTPCFCLDYAGFLNKRHYSHTPEQVNAIIKKNK